MQIQTCSILSAITDSFIKFKSSETTLESFFNRSKLHASKTQKLQQIYIKEKECSKQPMFVVKNRNHKIIFGWKLEELKARDPIKMPIEEIFAMFDKPFAAFNLEELPEFLQVFQVAEGKAFFDASLPGEPISQSKILVGRDQSDWYWIPNSDLIEARHYCSKLPHKCLFSSPNITHLKAHESTCTDQTKITSKQIALGNLDSKNLNLLVDAELLPENFRDHRQKYHTTFDIETLEEIPEIEDSCQQAILKVVSIACASNLPNQEERCFIRESTIQDLVDRFLDHLFELEEIFHRSIPAEINSAIQSLADVEMQKFSENRTKKQFLKRLLNNYTTLAVYGFNSSHFDLKCINAQIYNYSRRQQIEVSTIKRTGHYFSLNLEKRQGRTRRIQFRDVLNFSSPCSLDRYLKQWGASLHKSIFPHGYYKSVQELIEATDFPPAESFFNNLKNIPVDPILYQEARQEFNRRKNLPDHHVDKINNMRDWLIHYNLLDVKPLVEAIEKSFSTFFELFKIDPHTHHSLPSIAYQAMFSNVNPELPFGFTFDNQRDELRRWFRQNLIGGLTSVYHRHLDLSGSEDSPHAARHTPDGSALTHAIFLDFNSMYLWAQSEAMPLTPGILWTASGSTFKKSVMTSGTSFGAVQWLEYIQQTECFDCEGNRVQLHHKYHQGEVDFEGYKPDGYAQIDGEDIFFEYLGCRYHPGCCVPDNKIDDPQTKRRVWREKEKFFKSRGILYTMRECAWKKFLNSQLDLPSATSLGRIFHQDSQTTLLKAIVSGECWGYLCCDIDTPTEIIEKDVADGFLFPPVISRMNLEEKHLSPFMRERYEEERRTPSPTVVQTYSGRQVFVLSDLVKFYLDRGMKVTNITKFIQFVPGAAFKPFVTKVTEGRIQATYQKDEAKANTYKLFGNSGEFI